jgi:hypothetical protein
VTEKKRTTVTTIETHEVWVITPAPERPDDVMTVARLEAEQTDTVDPPTAPPAVPETGGTEVGIP